MHIRPPRDTELPILQDIERDAGRCFADIGMPEIAADEPLPVEALAGYLEAGRAWAAIGPGDVPIAYLIADLIDGNLHVEQVSVASAYARQGIGRRLLEEAEKYAAAHGIPALTLTTFTEVPWNAPYYARCGFHALSDGDLTPGLRAVREHEAEHGLDRWPRVCMRRQV